MEEWRPVVGYEEGYEVSNLGNVRSLDPRHYLKLKNLKSNKDGHLRVWLSKNSKKRAFFVHRLVAFAFIDNPDKKPIINHIDGVPFNNEVSNLEWCTHSENVRHAFDLGLNTPHCGGTSIPIVREDLSGNKKEYASMVEAGKDSGLSPGSIHYRVSTGKYFGEYKWTKRDEGVTTIRKE